MAVHDTALRWVLVETAGGAFSPISPHATNVELARALEPDISILVAPDALGVLHDVRATLLALRSMGREPDFVVLSAARARDASTGTNGAELARLGVVRPIAIVPRGKGSSAALAPLVRELVTRFPIGPRPGRARV